MIKTDFAPPKRSLGQNFLVDQNISRRIFTTLNPLEGAPILEIGPGRGALTQVLLSHRGSVFALEKDEALAFWLGQTWPNLQVIHGDALRFCWEKLADLPGLFVVGNLPYNIASPLIWEIVSRAKNWSAMVFMVQKEVAQRLTAVAGNRIYGALSAWVGNFAVPCYEFTVAPHVFRPRPKIDSAVVRLLPHPDPAWDQARGLSWTLKLLFQQRRKQLGRILKAQWSTDLEHWCAEWQVDRRVRPEELSPQALRTLSTILAPYFSCSQEV